MRIKRLLATVFVSLFMMQTVLAVPAYPGVIKARQADGTEISIRLHGDEHGHYTTTEDGYPLVFNEQTANYEYVRVENSVVVSSGIAAADASMRSAEAMAFLRSVDTDAFVKLCAGQRRQNVQNKENARIMKAQKHNVGLINNFPHFGEQRSVVLLVEFSDKSFTTMSDPKQYYKDALNKEGFTAINGANGSARDFFVASSAGNFLPTFDVYGPVKIGYSQRAFGEGTNMYEPNMATIIREAVKQLDDSVDFKQYDHDGDGYIDNIYVFYAGTGAADSNDRNVIWPHSYYVRSGFGVTIMTNDGVMVDSYTCSNEVNGMARSYTAGIGTFIHEFSHCLGLADHYDTDYRYTSYNPGSWDTMCSGCYNNDSNTPPLYSSFEKYSLGWIDLTELTNHTDTTCVLPYLGDTNKAYVMGVPGKDDEYYLFENRQRKGWDKYLPASGMLVWHIDYDEYIWEANMPNNIGSHQRIDIVEANGYPSGNSYWRTGVPFPGTDSVTTCPFRSWAGDTLTVLDKIAENDSIISFVIQGSDKNLVAPHLAVDSISDEDIRCTWQPVENAEYYRISVSRVNSDNTSAILADYDNLKLTDTLCVIKNLAEETEYEIRLTAGAGAYQTDADTIHATTTARPFTKYRVENIVAKEIYDAMFIASWDALDEAQTYSVTLSTQAYDGDTVSTSYDFADMSSGMPAGWETNSGAYAEEAGSYGEAAPALCFATDGDYLRLQNGDAMISHVGMWYKTSEQVSGSSLTVDRLEGDEWVAQDTITLKATKGETLNIGITPAKAVRLVFNRTGTDSLLVDDVAVSGASLKKTPLKEYDDKNVGNQTTYKFTGLQMMTDYYLTVTGVRNGERTLPSEPLLITTTDPTNGIRNTGTAAENLTETYDLMGRKMLRGATGNGIYIKRGGGKTVKVAR